MILIVGHVAAGSDKAKMNAAGQEIEVDLKDLLEYVIHTCMRIKVTETMNQPLQRSEYDPF